MKHFYLGISLVIGCWLLAAGTTSADTIRANDGKELKGIVLEDYKDRIVISTADGEITIMKSDIHELYYDTEEDNLIKLAEQAREHGDYGKSFAYYDRAFRANPASKTARDGLVFLQGYLFRQEQEKKESDVRKQEEFEHYGLALEIRQSEDEKLHDAIRRLRETTGISLVIKNGLPEIKGIAPGSPAYEAGVRNGDLLIAIWGRLTGYMSLREVVYGLLEKSSLEIKCLIERTVDVPINRNRGPLSDPNDLIGAAFGMEFDGLTIANVKEGSPSAAAGLKKNDLIMAIDGNSTRYMPLKKALELIKSSKNVSVKLTVRKEVLIWRVIEG